MNRAAATVPWGVMLILGAMLAVGCGEKGPTRYAKDPLVGKWIGAFSRLNGTMSQPGEFEIVIQSGGEAIASGSTSYFYSTTSLTEFLLVRMLVGEEGVAVGEGVHLIVSGGWSMMEGTAFAEFNAATGQGAGTFEIDFGEFVYQATWTVKKEGTP